MKIKKLAIPVIPVALVLIGFLAVSFFSEAGSATSLDAVQIEAQSGDGSGSTEIDHLILVNKDNKLPDNYSVDLTAVGGVKVSTVLLSDLKAMQSAAKKDNVQLYIDTAYRTPAEQEQIFRDTVADYVTQGNSQAAAVAMAKNLAALPGYSEHETGLAMDFSLEGNAKKQSAMWAWLGKNAYKYGFILRYPDGKEPITGYNYEPWHYRYVGKEHAKVIFEQNLTLEEYLQTL